MRHARRHVHAMQALAFSSSAVHQVKVIPAETAQLVSLRSAGTVQVPGEVQDGLDKAASGALLPTACRVVAKHRAWALRHLITPGNSR